MCFKMAGSCVFGPVAVKQATPGALALEGTQKIESGDRLGALRTAMESKWRRERDSKFAQIPS